MLTYRNGELVVTDEKRFSSWLNDCKVKHYKKIPYDKNLSELLELFSEEPRFILAKLQIVFWKYFNENEEERFKDFVKNLISYKMINFKTSLNEALKIKLDKLN
jgi:hypothetical protein